MSRIKKLSEQLSTVSLSDYSFYLTRRAGYHSIQVEVSGVRVSKYLIDEGTICNEGLDYLLDKLYSLPGSQDLELLAEEYFILLLSEERQYDALTSIVLQSYSNF